MYTSGRVSITNQIINFFEEVPARDIHITGTHTSLTQIGLDDSPDNNQTNTSNIHSDKHSKHQEEFKTPDEIESFAFHEFGKGNVGVLQTFFNTFKSYIGIGILATPAAFKEVTY